MTAKPSFWRQVIDAFLHRGPGYELPTTAERYAQARITYALAHCDRIERELRGRNAITVTDAHNAIRCIRGALDPDGAP
ncbi:hypothetical protein AB0D11_02280 [Streptomyces monashensis]|uniref:hypothetical protein n=1 Tax=Streptomyces monashensis TaxID=1678012 RepID=UPI003406E5B5